jgi:hypothetical protein
VTITLVHPPKEIRMASWNDLVAHISQTYRHEILPSGNVKMLFSIDESRSQVVLVSEKRLMGGDESWAEISSAIGDLDSVNLRAALPEAGEMVCGGLGADGGLLMFRHAVPLENLDVNEFERPLQLVVLSADHLEKHLVGGDAF